MSVSRVDAAVDAAPWRGRAGRIAGARALAFWILAAAASGAPAAAPTAADAFDDGVAAYRAERYETALNAFLAARRRGMEHPNLDLNLGLTYYRLGRYYEARESFGRVRNDLRYTDIADYHLGLVAAALGERDTAVGYLQSVQSTAGPTGLRDLATVALRRLDDVPLEEDPATLDAVRPDGTYYLRAATGFDSNPELVSDTLDRPIESEGAGYAELLGTLEHPLGVSALGATAFRANLRLRQHDGEEGFDQQGGELGLRQIWRAGSWRVALTGEGGAAWLEGEAYENTGTLGLDGRRSFGGTTATLRYDALRVAGEGAYDYLDGWRHRGEIALARSFGILRGRADVEYERNDRRDLAIGEEFASYSPTRRSLGVALSTPALRRLSVEWRARHRASRYRDPNRFIEDGTLREARRADDLLLTGLRARWRAGESWNWMVDYQYSRNDSSLADFAYARHLATLGIEWLR